MMKTKNKITLTEIENWEHKRKIKLIILGVFCGVIAIVSLLISLGSFGDNAWKEIYNFFGISDFTEESKDYPLNVSFINVDDGDCILIECEGHAGLIDSGVLSLHGTARKYIEKRNIGLLDFVVCTHNDNDHIGDMKSIFDNFDVQKCYMTKLSENKQSESMIRLNNALKSNNITCEILDLGDSLNLGAMKFEVISPEKVYDEDNDNSIVLRATYGEVSFLFTGDSGVNAETDILTSGKNIKSTVLKVAHHGSKTATTGEFLKAVSPEIAVVSVGDTNKYLPNKETIDRINSFGCEILRTDESGTIILASDGKKIFKFKEK